jgi:hypothetical protein
MGFQAVPPGTVHGGEGGGYGMGAKGSTYGKSRLPGGVAVMAEKRNGKRRRENVTISRKRYHLRSRGADYALRDGKPKGRVGEVRPAAAVQRRGGRKPTVRKKTQTWTFAFFSTSRPPATGRGLSLPL